MGEVQKDADGLGMNVQMAEDWEESERVRLKSKEQEAIFWLWIDEVEEKRETNKYNRFEIMDI